MKKRFVLIIAFAVLMSLSACNSNNNPSNSSSNAAENMDDNNADMDYIEPEDSEIETNDPAEADNATESTAQPDMNSGVSNSARNILIAYFMVPETDGIDTVAGASRVAVNGETLGNTQYVAQAIQQAAGGELFQIQTTQEYPGTHAPLLDFAAQEKAENARPELSTKIENLDRYDVIFIGYPNWNADLPMPLYTFLEEYDFNGKTIIPFCTHGGSGFSNTIQTIAQLQPNAQVETNGYTVSRNNIVGSEDEVAAWLNSLGLAQ